MAAGGRIHPDSLVSASHIWIGKAEGLVDEDKAMRPSALC